MLKATVLLNHNNNISQFLNHNNNISQYYYFTVLLIK